jgi:hypothetical protein
MMWLYLPHEPQQLPNITNQHAHILNALLPLLLLLLSAAAQGRSMQELPRRLDHHHQGSPFHQGLQQTAARAHGRKLHTR